MKAVLALLGTALLLVGCGGDSSPERERATTTAEEAAPATDAEKPAKPEKDERQAGTEIVTGDSEFGEMLFDERDQAIYVFENDPRGESACYEECAEAWPPVLTNGEPEAGDGLDEELLGTVERDDGETQVTYAGRPLYFYAHEAPGEVRCHNVDLNGGLWWVLGPDGEPRP